MNRRLDTDEKKRVVLAYRKGSTIRELAASFGSSYGAIHKVLSNAGVEMRPRGGNQR